MNSKDAKIKFEEYSFLKGRALKKISENESNLFIINTIVVAPKELSEFTQNFDWYFDNLNLAKLPSAINYDIYLFKSRQKPGFFIRLSDAINDYEVRITYSQLLNYYIDLYNKAEVNFINAQLKMANESEQTTSAFFDKRLFDNLEKMDIARKHYYHKMTEMKSFVKNVPNPEAELFLGLKADDMRR